MACERFKERLIEEAAAPGGDRALADHLASCAGCRADLVLQQELQVRIEDGISAMVSGEPSPALMARIRMQIAAEPAPSRFAWMWIPAGVTTAAVMGFAFWIGARHFIQHVEQVREPVRVVKNNAPQQPVLQRNAPAAASNRREPMRKANTIASRMRDRELIPPLVITTVGVQESAVSHDAVVIPPGQREAVLKLVAALRSGRVDVAGLAQPAPVQEITPMEIKPLKIAALGDEKAAESTSGGHKQ
jgi:hypothetical protein